MCAVTEAEKGRHRTQDIGHRTQADTTCVSDSTLRPIFVRVLLIEILIRTDQSLLLFLLKVQKQFWFSCMYSAHCALDSSIVQVRCTSCFSFISEIRENVFTKALILESVQ